MVRWNQQVSVKLLFVILMLSILKECLERIFRDHSLTWSWWEVCLRWNRGLSNTTQKDESGVIKADKNVTLQSKVFTHELHSTVRNEANDLKSSPWSNTTCKCKPSQNRRLAVCGSRTTTVGVRGRKFGMSGDLHRPLVCWLRFENSLPRIKRTKKAAAENFSLAKLVYAGWRGSVIRCLCRKSRRSSFIFWESFSSVFISPSLADFFDEITLEKTTKARAINIS